MTRPMPRKTEARNVAVAVAENAYKTNVATNYPKPDNLLEYVKNIMYDPFRVEE